MHSPGASSQQADQPANKGIWQNTFASLAEREYAWFFSGHLLFSMGMQMQFILFGFLAFHLTGSAKILGLVGLAGAFSTLFVGPLGGAFADRLDKRYLIAAAQTCAAVSMAVIAVLTISDVIKVWHLVVASLLNGALMSINMPARQALVPQLVPRHKLMNAISLQMGGMNLTSIIGPALASFLIDPLGIGWVYGIGAALFLGATWSMLRLPKHGMVFEREQRSVISELREGFGFVWRDPTLRALILLNLLMPMLFFPARQLLPVFAVEVFERGASGLGMMATAAGIGGVLGALLSANLSHEPRKGPLMFLGGMTMALFTMLFALAPAFELAVLCLAISAAGQMLLMNTTSTVIQASLPSEMRGRISAMMGMSFGLSPVVVFPIAVAADSFGAPATIAVSSLVSLALLAGFFASSPRLRHLRQDALQRSQLSEVQAATLVARGEINREEAANLSGRS